MLAEVFKLLGNSGYGKPIEAMKWQASVIYTRDEKVVDRALRSASFTDLDELRQAYEVGSRKLLSIDQSGLSRSELLCFSWQSRECSCSTMTSWIGISIAATSS